MEPKRHTLLSGIAAMAIGIGWLALVSLLNYGGLWTFTSLGVQPGDVDLPVTSPDEVQNTIFQSFIVVLGCAAILGACEVVRRRVNARSRAVVKAGPPA